MRERLGRRLVVEPPSDSLATPSLGPSAIRVVALATGLETAQQVLNQTDIQVVDWLLVCLKQHERFALHALSFVPPCALNLAVHAALRVQSWMVVV